MRKQRYKYSNHVTDYELKPGERNIRVTEETKHEYVDLVADHILTNAIRPQINSFLEGFDELVPRELVSICNDKELELLISGLPEIDLDDLIANTEYTGYTTAFDAVQWFWEVVQSFNEEDMARVLQFVTGTSKETGRPLPKFGEWDVNDPASAEGFTVIFNKARNEKKTGGKPESPTKMDINARHGVEPLRTQKKWFCCM
ncbi:E3 ubiquitin-protein ligase UPL1-like isoform X2 [Primulina huaijiensis]|uniref:E3 ubiquitin-protein ligase UPL1-like isoform X2 n=1 Tax=Primulina huaijiensis TaxID=1492673 RepID=UPI003CC71CF3